MKLNELIVEQYGNMLTDKDDIIAWINDVCDITEGHFDDVIVEIEPGLISIDRDLDFKFSLDKLQVRFQQTGSFSLNGCGIKTLEGCPREVYGDFNAAGNSLTSLEGAPHYVSGNCFIGRNPLTSLEGIADIIKQINSTIYLPAGIKSGGIGLIFIEQLKNVNLDMSKPPSHGFDNAIRIIKKYLRQPDKVFECQTELIEAGLEEFAKL